MSKFKVIMHGKGTYKTKGMSTVMMVEHFDVGDDKKESRTWHGVVVSTEEAVISDRRIVNFKNGTASDKRVEKLPC